MAREKSNGDARVYDSFGVGQRLCRKFQKKKSLVNDFDVFNGYIFILRSAFKHKKKLFRLLYHTLIIIKTTTYANPIIYVVRCSFSNFRSNI